MIDALIVLSNAAVDREGDFEQWYRDHHIGEICAIDGVISGEFCKAVMPEVPWTYLGYYQLASGALPEVLVGIDRIRNSGEMTPPNGIDPSTVAFLTGKSIGDRDGSSSGGALRLVQVSGPVAGEEVQQNDQLSDHHILEMLSVPGINSAIQFRLAEGTRGGYPGWSRVVVYEADAAHPAALLEGIRGRAGTAQKTKPPTLDQGTEYTGFYRVLHLR